MYDGAGRSVWLGRSPSHVESLEAPRSLITLPPLFVWGKEQKGERRDERQVAPSSSSLLSSSTVSCHLKKNVTGSSGWVILDKIKVQIIFPGHSISDTNFSVKQQKKIASGQLLFIYFIPFVASVWGESHQSLMESGLMGSRLPPRCHLIPVFMVTAFAHLLCEASRVL